MPEEEKKEEIKVEQSEGSKVATMKNGEYMLHVLVETAKNLGLEGEATIDPLVKITMMDKTKDTTAKKDITRSS